MCYQENHEKCCQNCCQKSSLKTYFLIIEEETFGFENFYLNLMKIALRKFYDCGSSSARDRRFLRFKIYFEKRLDLGKRANAFAGIEQCRQRK